MTEKQKLDFTCARFCWLISSVFSIIMILWYAYEYRYLWIQRSRRCPMPVQVKSEFPNITFETFIRHRLEESEQIWKKGIEQRRQAEAETPVPPDKPWTIAYFRTVWDFFYPNFNCPHTVERLGRVGDGGKWVCGISRLAKLGSACIVYSFGVAGDTSFEQDVLNRTNCSLHAYDYTVRASKVPLPEMYPERATFSRLGLGPANLGLMRTLKFEMDQRDHTFIDILKIDIEGGEFQSLEQILTDFPQGLPFGQLLIELHLGRLGTKGMFKRLKGWWEALETGGLRAFHSEPNLYALTPRRTRPKFYEMSFLNVKVDSPILHA